MAFVLGLLNAPARDADDGGMTAPQLGAPTRRRATLRGRSGVLPIAATVGSLLLTALVTMTEYGHAHPGVSIKLLAISAAVALSGLCIAAPRMLRSHEDRIMLLSVLATGAIAVYAALAASYELYSWYTLGRPGGPIK